MTRLARMFRITVAITAVGAGVVACSSGPEPVTTQTSSEALLCQSEGIGGVHIEGCPIVKPRPRRPPDHPVRHWTLPGGGLCGRAVRVPSDPRSRPDRRRRRPQLRDDLLPERRRDDGTGAAGCTVGATLTYPGPAGVDSNDALGAYKAYTWICPSWMTVPTSIGSVPGCGADPIAAGTQPAGSFTVDACQYVYSGAEVEAISTPNDCFGSTVSSQDVLVQERIFATHAWTAGHKIIQGGCKNYCCGVTGLP